MKVAFVGEVDHGKSTLIGRLLLDTKSLPSDKFYELEKISQELGVDACLAFLVDQFTEEREGLLTIDTTETVLKTKKRAFVCIDTPGHLKFLKNMMTGTSHADAAVIVIDALHGIEEQTHLHAQIVKMFGITPVLFAVNKIDLIDYQEGPFRSIERDISVLCEKTGLTPQAVIPVSAQYGINTAARSEKTKWYKGKPLIAAMIDLKDPLSLDDLPLRLSVQDIYQIDGRPVIVGRLSQGTVNRNQKVIVSPSLEEVRIDDIKVFGQKRASAHSGENIGLCCSRPAKIKRGDVICGTAGRLSPTRQFQAQILWMDKEPLNENEKVTVRVSTQQLPCTVKNIERSTNASTFDVTLDSAVPAAVEPFSINNELGRFVMEKKGRRSGAGIITKTLGMMVLILPLIYLLSFPPRAFAQNDTEGQNSFLTDFTEKLKDKGWQPFTDKDQGTGRNSSGNDLKDLQSLTYLQGYDPAPVLKNVVKYDKNRSFPGYNLFLSGNVPGAILMDMSGKTIYQWRYPSAALPIDQRYCSGNWDRVRILKGGDLLALITFGGLLKIDKDSRLIWFKKIICHHDFDIDSDGNIYTLTVNDVRSGENADLKINSIAILSPRGEIKKEISLYDLFKKYPDPSYINMINRLSHYPTDITKKFPGFIPGDVFHSNAIQVLDGKWGLKNPAFKKGNLLITLRNLGVIISVDPQKEEIEWLMDRVFWQRREHSARLLDNGDILIFDNYYHPDLSRVVEFDPAAPRVVWDYSNQAGRFFSAYLGEGYRLPNGNTLITESENGHSFEVTPDKKIVWEFYNPNQIDKNSKMFLEIRQQGHLPDRYDKLIAIIIQMQRIPLDSTSGWLKN